MATKINWSYWSGLFDGIEVALKYPIGKYGIRVSEKDMNIRNYIKHELQKLKRINYRDSMEVMSYRH